MGTTQQIGNLLPQNRAAALAAWHDFLPYVRAYSARRNHIVADHRNVSRLSFAIRHRLIGEDEIIADTLQQINFNNAEKWLQEICWRRYWKGWLEVRPDVWNSWRKRVRELRESLPAEVLEKAESVAAGRSGVACMDAIARELIDTGYLHNHARMWWASFWIHGEKLPWELGADFFYRHLLDADAASNTLSWRWVAGLQTSGKTYIVRWENLRKYMAAELLENTDGSERIADGAITAQLCQEFADTTKIELPTFPNKLPSISSRCGLWLHMDDLMPEIGPLAEMKPLAIASVKSEHLNTNAHAAAMDDALTRSAAYFHCPAKLITLNEFTAWVQAHQLTEVVAYAPFIGPEQDLLDTISAQLEKLGIPLTLLRRESDAVAFSYSSSGFFPYWKKMSRHIIHTYPS